MRSLIDIQELSVAELDELISVAEDIIANPKKYAEIAKGKKLATLFFEPSTRTRLSFEAAMYELGGNVLSVSSAGSSSAAKGESIADTAKTVSCYADIIAMRHPLEGAPYVASLNASIPVINAGDGGHNHPTQTLADLLTIWREKGRFSDLTIGLCGDLKFGRTVHSLIGAMSRYSGVKFVLISPEELKLPSYVKTQVLEANGIEYEENTDLLAVMPRLDILYMTRVQRERFSNQDDYLRLKDSYILTPDKLDGAKKDLSILHPLPRVNEIAVSIDNDPRACYFKQVLNGKYMRMALILKLLGLSTNQACQAEGKEQEAMETSDAFVCQNPRCITTTEQELPQRFKLADKNKRVYRCIYCEAKANS
ncbi:MAG: aspartate carbamoyltransferase [Ruminococcaceae bacterium]|nr:aspartate carbamoyltransferase [Oscillospiraceae bacterium]